MRDPEVGAAFEKLLWVSVGQQPDLMQLLRVLYFRLTETKMAQSIDEVADAAHLLKRDDFLGKASVDLSALLSAASRAMRLSSVSSASPLITAAALVAAAAPRLTLRFVERFPFDAVCGTAGG